MSEDDSCTFFPKKPNLSGWTTHRDYNCSWQVKGQGKSALEADTREINGLASSENVFRAPKLGPDHSLPVQKRYAGSEMVK